MELQDDIFTRLQSGDMQAYKEVFITCYPALCQYASRFVSDSEVEEIVQNLMMHLWEHRKTLVIGSSLKSYLFVATKNRCLNHLRDRRLRERVHAAIYDRMKDRFDDPDYYLANELADRIDLAIAGLPDIYREVFELSRFDAYSYKRIAEQLQLSEKTVEYRMSQALSILRRELKDYLPLLVFIMLL